METINNFKGLLVYATPDTSYSNNDIINITDNAPDVLDYVILDRTSAKPSASKFLNVAKDIYQRKSNARFWIGTPNYDSYTHPEYTYIKGSLDEIKTAFMNDSVGRIIWNNRVKGIYLNMESIYDTINYNLNANQNGSACLTTARNLSDYVHNTLDINLLWIPYYGYGTNPNKVIKDLAYMVARTDIFDIVIIQPHYYFADDEDNLAVNLDAVKYCVDCNNICYRDGVEVFTRTFHRAKVGFEMEISRAVEYTKKGENETDEEYEERVKDPKKYRAKYEEYVNKFKSCINAPVCYYAGSIHDIGYKYILIEDFYGTSYGDADGNGILTANDAAIVLQYSLNGSSLSDELMRICDVDDNGIITAYDAASIMQKISDNSYDFDIIKKAYSPFPEQTI